MYQGRSSFHGKLNTRLRLAKDFSFRTYVGDFRAGGERDQPQVSVRHRNEQTHEQPRSRPCRSPRPRRAPPGTGGLRPSGSPGAAGEEEQSGSKRRGPAVSAHAPRHRHRLRSQTPSESGLVLCVCHSGAADPVKCRRSLMSAKIIDKPFALTLHVDFRNKEIYASEEILRGNPLQVVCEK